MLLNSRGHERARSACVHLCNTDASTNTGQKYTQNMEYTQITHTKCRVGNFLSCSPPAGPLTVLVSSVKGGGRGIIAAVGPFHTDGRGPAHMLTEHYTSLSPSPCRAPPECTGAPSGILMIPIQFGGARATSWMSSVDTSV